MIWETIDKLAVRLGNKNLDLETLLTAMLEIDYECARDIDSILETIATQQESKQN